MAASRRPRPRTSRTAAAVVAGALAALAAGLLGASAPASAGGHAAERSFGEAWVVPAGEVTVRVEASGFTDFGRITETLPEGWTYAGSSLPEAAVSVAGRDIRLRVLDEAAFTYTVTARRALGTYAFSGVIEDATRLAAAVSGDETVTVRARAPWPHCLKGAVAEGLSLVVYEGGALEELLACAESRGLEALYALHEGRYLAYVLGAPEFVNRGFRELFADGVPALTPLVARSDGPPSGDPVGDVRAPDAWPGCLRGEVAVGLSLLVYAGGSLGELAACAESLGVTALYVLHEGEWTPYIPGAPAFVNRNVGALFAGGVPPITPLIVTSEAPTPRPDLVAGLAAVSDGSPVPGQALTLDVTVRNRGPGASRPTTLRFFRSADPIVTREDTQVGSVPISGLDASARSVESVVTDAPSVAGVHYYGACVDPVSLEPDTSNNCSPTVAVTVAAPGFTLSGTVRDGRRNGPLLAGATVRLGDGPSTTTDPSGRYRFPNVSGTVTVRATSPYYAAEVVELAVRADRTVDFALETEGIVPYPGTVFITADLIGPADPTSLESVTYAGRGVREIYDRRPAAWITVNAYLFRARYGNAAVEFQVNPEFGSREAARAEVDAYAAALGRLPAVLLSRARKVHLNAGHELFGGNWSDRSFLIHTGQGQEYIRDGFLEEALIHEGGHVSVEGAHRNSAGWRAAQAADGVFISEYARDYPHREDVAESILPYFAVRYRPERLSDADRTVILATVPNRLAYFDEQGLDFAPYAAPTTDPSVSQVADMSHVGETFTISGLVSGPDGEPLEGIGVWAWQAQGETGESAETGADGTFLVRVPRGSFTLDVYADLGAGCTFVGWYDGAGGLATERSRAATVALDDAGVEGIEIRLPDDPGRLPFIEWCS